MPYNVVTNKHANLLLVQMYRIPGASNGKSLFLLFIFTTVSVFVMGSSYSIGKLSHFKSGSGVAAYSYLQVTFQPPYTETSMPGVGTPLYKPYRYVRPQRVWVLNRFGLKKGQKVYAL